MTNNSLAASQRPNISLIDRRLSGARRVPYRVRFNVKSMLGKKQEASLPLDRDKPYQRSRSGALRGFISQRSLHRRVGHLVSYALLRHAA